MNIGAKSVAKVTLEATVIRADGTRKELGVISSYERPKWRRLLDKFKLGKE